MGRGREQDPTLALLGEAVVDRLEGGGIQPDGRGVQQEGIGVHEQPAREPHPLGLATGEDRSSGPPERGLPPLRQYLDDLGETSLLGRLGDLVVGGVRSPVGHSVTQRAGEEGVVGRDERGAGNLDATPGLRHQSVQGLEEGRLAGPGVALDPEGAVATEVHVDVLQDDGVVRGEAKAAGAQIGTGRPGIRGGIGPREDVLDPLSRCCSALALADGRSERDGGRRHLEHQQAHRDEFAKGDGVAAGEQDRADAEDGREGEIRDRAEHGREARVARQHRSQRMAGALDEPRDA